MKGEPAVDYRAEAVASTETLCPILSPPDYSWWSESWSLPGKRLAVHGIER